MPGEKALLIGRRAQLYCQTELYFKKMQKAEQLYRRIQNKYYNSKWDFEKADRELAMVDGRYKVLDPPDKKKPKEIKLTTEQLLEVAAQLGIEVEGGEGDDF